MSEKQYRPNQNAKPFADERRAEKYAKGITTVNTLKAVGKRTRREQVMALVKSGFKVRLARRIVDRVRAYKHH